MARVKNIYGIGSTVTVKASSSGYPLPAGLPDGARVRVVARDEGYDVVEYRGQRFEVAMACIEPGHTITPD